MRDFRRSIRFPPFVLDLDRAVLFRDREAVEIHATPLRLLIHLVRNRDRVVSKDELLDHVWTGAIVGDAAVSSAVNEVRRALGDSGVRQAAIRTERGRGYRFVAEIRPSFEDRPLAAREEGPDAVRVAVLPFVDMSSGGNETHLANSVTEEIINELVHSHGLLVAARTSSFAFRDAGLDIREIGAAMGVEAAVEGSIRKEGDRLRVCAQLIRISDGFHLWSETFDHVLDDCLDVETRIAESVAHELETRLVDAIAV